MLVSLYASPSAQAALIELIAVTAAVSATPILSGAVPSPILSRQRLHEAPVQGPQASRSVELHDEGMHTTGRGASKLPNHNLLKAYVANFQSHKATTSRRA